MIHVFKMGKSRRQVSSEEKKMSEKNNSTNFFKLKLLRNIGNVNKTAAFYFQLEWYSVNRTIIISYKLHQRQLKIKKTNKQTTISYITELYCAPRTHLFKFPCQFATPIWYQARLVAIGNTTRTGLSKDIFSSVLTIPKKKLYSVKTNLTQLYISISFFKGCVRGLNVL